MKNKVINDTKVLMEEKFGHELTEKVLLKATEIFEGLVDANKDQIKDVKQHTVKKIYPCIAMYRALIGNGVSKDDALAFMDYSQSKLAEVEAKQLQSMMKIPGMYKLMPRIFTFVTKSTFGEKAGFKATFYDKGKTECRFDMTKCLYFDTCKANGCPELTKIFCHTDDVKDGNMHEKLIWHRTKIIGDGGDCCDFDLYIKE